MFPQPTSKEAAGERGCALSREDPRTYWDPTPAWSTRVCRQGPQSLQGSFVLQEGHNAEDCNSSIHHQGARPCAQSLA